MVMCTKYLAYSKPQYTSYLRSTFYLFLKTGASTLPLKVLNALSFYNYLLMDSFFSHLSLLVKGSNLIFILPIASFQSILIIQIV